MMQALSLPHVSFQDQEVRTLQTHCCLRCLVLPGLSCSLSGQPDPVLLLVAQALQRRFSAEEHRDEEFQRTLERDPSDLSSWSDERDSIMEDVTNQSGVLISDQGGSHAADLQETWQRNPDGAGKQGAQCSVMHHLWNLASHKLWQTLMNDVMCHMFDC